MDNDFLVYDTSAGKYKLFNATEEVCFKEYETLSDFLASERNS